MWKRKNFTNYANMKEYALGLQLINFLNQYNIKEFIIIDNTTGYLEIVYKENN